jgi:hypothetical protein
MREKGVMLFEQSKNSGNHSYPRQTASSVNYFFELAQRTGFKQGAIQIT